MASKQALLSLSRGAPPRTGIERELKDLLHKHTHQRTVVGSVKSHIRIPGNEKAVRRAAYESGLARIAGSRQVATAAGIGMATKSQEKSPAIGTSTDTPYQPTHSNAPTAALLATGSTSSGRLTYQPALTVTTSRRTATISPSIAPSTRQQRQDFIGDIRTWQELDRQKWRKGEGEEEKRNAVEAYFAYLYRTLTGRSERLLILVMCFAGYTVCFFIRTRNGKTQTVEDGIELGRVNNCLYSNVNLTQGPGAHVTGLPRMTGGVAGSRFVEVFDIVKGPGDPVDPIATRGRRPTVKIYIGQVKVYSIIEE
ncbi:hypothetical protein EV426DRAFT_707398 [Tirmania nivea]|nr:hypothetical protein EV426DRAFT_707398 [Tirmania nivea]